MPIQSEILSFFVYGGYQGGLGGGMSSIFPCITQRIQLTLRLSTSEVVHFIVWRVCG